jgi:DNA polymerase V
LGSGDECGSSTLMLALCDCNSFYASCETVFDPKLLGKPVIVLSSNDGCVVARSPQAKTIGIKMGEPAFKIKRLIEQQNVQVFSSNYALYGDLSQRVMTALAEFTPELEIYSIDEALLNLSGFGHLDLTQYGQQIRQTVLQWTGVSTSIGIAPTKVLTKVAGDYAKKRPDGVLFMPQPPDPLLAEFSVADLWGIGQKHSQSLQGHGITTALQLRDVELSWARKQYSVVMQRIVLELRGQPCFSLELNPSPKKSITVSRSFSRAITTLAELREAIATYTSRAAEKLRQHELTADAIQIFALTSRFRADYYSDSVTLSFDHSSGNTAEILKFAFLGGDRIYQPHLQFTKAGVILLGLRHKSQRQLSLWEPTEERSDALMQTMDSINAQFGRGTLQFTAAGLKKSWGMRQERRSPRWTTCWSELPIARA